MTVNNINKLPQNTTINLRQVKCNNYVNYSIKPDFHSKDEISFGANPFAKIKPMASEFSTFVGMSFKNRSKIYKQVNEAFERILNSTQDYPNLGIVLERIFAPNLDHLNKYAQKTGYLPTAGSVHEALMSGSYFKALAVKWKGIIKALVSEPYVSNAATMEKSIKRLQDQPELLAKLDEIAKKNIAKFPEYVAPSPEKLSDGARKLLNYSIEDLSAIINNGNFDKHSEHILDNVRIYLKTIPNKHRFDNEPKLNAFIEFMAYRSDIKTYLDEFLNNLNSLNFDNPNQIANLIKAEETVKSLNNVKKELTQVLSGELAKIPSEISDLGYHRRKLATCIKSINEHDSAKESGRKILEAQDEVQKIFENFKILKKELEKYNSETLTDFCSMVRLMNSN